MEPEHHDTVSSRGIRQRRSSRASHPLPVHHAPAARAPRRHHGRL